MSKVLTKLKKTIKTVKIQESNNIFKSEGVMNTKLSPLRQLDSHDVEYEDIISDDESEKLAILEAKYNELSNKAIKYKNALKDQNLLYQQSQKKLNMANYWSSFWMCCLIIGSLVAALASYSSEIISLYPSKYSDLMAAYRQIDASIDPLYSHLSNRQFEEFFISSRLSSIVELFDDNRSLLSLQHISKGVDVFLSHADSSNSTARDISIRGLRQYASIYIDVLSPMYNIADVMIQTLTNNNHRKDDEYNALQTIHLLLVKKAFPPELIEDLIVPLRQRVDEEGNLSGDAVQCLGLILRNYRHKVSKAEGSEIMMYLQSKVVHGGVNVRQKAMLAFSMGDNNRGESNFEW